MCLTVKDDMRNPGKGGGQNGNEVYLSKEYRFIDRVVGLLFKKQG